MIDWTKPLVTKGRGFKARLVCTDANIDGGKSHIAIVTCTLGRQLLIAYHPDGKRHRGFNTPEDLINPPTPLPTQVLYYFRNPSATVGELKGRVYACVGGTTSEDLYRNAGFELVAKITVKGNEGDGVPVPQPAPPKVEDDEDEEE